MCAYKRKIKADAMAADDYAAEPQKTYGPCSRKQQLVLMENSVDILLTGGGAGGGKALKHGEQVLTTSGFKNIEEIKVGEYIITPSNKVEKVTGVYPQGLVDIYKVTFQDGREVETCGEHLWKYHISGKGKVSSRVDTTLSMKELADKNTFRTRNRLPIVPLCSPVTLPYKGESPIKPYTLGALLGDGSFSMATPGLTSADEHVFQKVMQDGYVYGHVSAKEGNASVTKYILRIYDKVRELGLEGKTSEYKFIPDVAKNGSIADRWSLIQGLMDTDGYISVEGKTYYTTVSKKLSEDIKYVLNSLGFTVTITSKMGMCNGKQGLEAYTLYIRGAEQNKLFTLPRKLARVKVKEVGNRVVSITKQGVSEATCISISGEEKLFLTTNFVVTHNTQMALTKALGYIDDPYARVLIMRATFPLLKAIGGIWNTASEMYADFGAVAKIQSLEFHFPSGAMVKLVAIPDNLQDVLGWQPTHVLFDEATEASLEAILALQARIRSVKYKGPKMGMLLTCNPERKSWLYDWVEYSLDENGIPKAGTENITRYFVNHSGKIRWANSIQELYDTWGKGKVLGKTFIPLSFKFIPLTIDDNPVLDKTMPEYRANLLNQSRVNQLRLLHGSWTAILEGASNFRREWVTIVDYPPINPAAKVRSWDLAHSVPSEVYPNPDWTAGVLMSRTRSGGYCIENVVRDRKLTDDVVKIIVNTGENDGKDIPVTIPRDNGGGKAASMFFLRGFAEEGMNVRGIPISAHSSKLQRFLPFCTLAQSGCVTMVKGDWNEDFLTELELFDGINKNLKDDQVDATSDAFNTLAKQIHMPTISVPSMTKDNPVPRI